MTLDGVLGLEPPLSDWKALLLVDNGDDGRLQCDDKGEWSDVPIDALSSGVARPPCRTAE